VKQTAENAEEEEEDKEKSEEEEDEEEPRRTKARGRNKSPTHDSMKCELKLLGICVNSCVL
jgi:hypothetical protein